MEFKKYERYGMKQEDDDLQDFLTPTSKDKSSNYGYSCSQGIDPSCPEDSFLGLVYGYPEPY